MRLRPWARAEAEAEAEPAVIRQLRGVCGNYRPSCATFLGPGEKSEEEKKKKEKKATGQIDTPAAQEKNSPRCTLAKLNGNARLA